MFRVVWMAQGVRDSSTPSRVSHTADEPPLQEPFSIFRPDAPRPDWDVVPPHHSICVSCHRTRPQGPPMRKSRCCAGLAGKGQVRWFAPIVPRLQPRRVGCPVHLTLTMAHMGRGKCWNQTVHRAVSSQLIPLILSLAALELP
jgi:hypothetical protein